MSTAPPPAAAALRARLATELARRGLLQKDLASALGVTAPTISLWKAGAGPAQAALELSWRI